MNKDVTFRKFDGVSVCAVIGCAVVVLFESFFIFELYRMNPEVLPKPLQSLFPERESVEIAPAVVPSESQEVSEAPEPAVAATNPPAANPPVEEVPDVPATKPVQIEEKAAPDEPPVSSPQNPSPTDPDVLPVG